MILYYIARLPCVGGDNVIFIGGVVCVEGSTPINDAYHASFELFGTPIKQ